MSVDIDRGPLRMYEITWRSGHVETVQGHQVMFDSWRIDTGGLFGRQSAATRAEREPRFFVHGEFGGHWRLVLSGLESEVHTFRDVTDREQMPGEAA